MATGKKKSQMPELNKCLFLCLKFSPTRLFSLKTVLSDDAQCGGQNKVGQFYSTSCRSDYAPQEFIPFMIQCMQGPDQCHQRSTVKINQEESSTDLKPSHTG